MKLTKKCGKCRIDQPVSNFPKNKSRYDGLYYACKSCKKDISAAYREANRDQINERCRAKQHLQNPRSKAWKDRNPDRVKNYGLKYLYGVTLEEYNQMLELQEHKCAICKRHQKDLSKKLAVDHNHRTDKVRGLLCGPCNRAIGLMRDDPQTIQRAAAYVAKDQPNGTGS